MAKDYYTILGIDKKAGKDEIKKAFRKLAHRYHPDKKGGDEAKFKEASEAYAVLSDDKKRAEYDAYGRVFSGGAPGGAGGFEGFDFNDIFKGFTASGAGEFAGNVNMDDLFGGFADMFGGGNRQNRRGRDISIDVELPFKEAIFGVTRKILITKDSICEKCSGSGAEHGTSTKTCTTCSGKGQVVEQRRSPFGVFQSVSMCPTCHGRRVVPETPCAECKGRGVKNKQDELTVNIPAGIENGQMIRMTGMGEAVPGGSAGDLYIKVHVEPHRRFRKEGVNLVTELPVKITDALLGAEYTIETLDGNLSVKVPPLRLTDEILRVKGKGVPTEGGRRGDLLIRVKVEFPQKLSKKAKGLLSDLREEGI